jgi:opacity protein-like surface antigen
MKYPVRALFLAAVCSASVAGADSAFADTYRSGSAGVYAGLGYNFITIDDGLDQLDVSTVSARIGVQPHPFFGLEGRLGFSADESRLGGVDYSLDNTAGAYAVLNLANESPLTPYFMFGVSRIEIEANSIAGTTTEEDSDFSFGAGLDIEVAENLSGNIEYLQYYDNGSTVVDGIGLGVTLRF